VKEIIDVFQMAEYLVYKSFRQKISDGYLIDQVIAGFSLFSDDALFFLKLSCLCAK